MQRRITIPPRAGEERPELASFVELLHKKFMDETGANLKIAAFYMKEVQPLLEENEFKGVDQIESKFAEKVESLKKEKGIGKDIIEGYSHVLTLFKLHACFQFHQVTRRSSSAAEVLSPLSTVSPGEAKSPPPRELSKEFKALQESATERLLEAYEKKATEWIEAPFDFDKTTWITRVKSLNESTVAFNRELKDIKFSPIEVSDEEGVDDLEKLVSAEKKLAEFFTGIQQPTLQKHQQLMDSHGAFTQGSSGALIVLNQTEQMRCDRLKTAPIDLKLSSEELAQFEGTEEYKIVTSIFTRKAARFQEKKLQVKGTDDAIALLLRQFDRLEQDFDQTSLFGSLSMRHRIFVLLRQFKAFLEGEMSAYKGVLQGVQNTLDGEMVAIPQKLELRRKKLLELCVAAIGEQIKKEIEPLQAGAISVRGEKCAEYVSQLKPKLAVDSIQDVTFLREKYEEKEKQFDALWEFEFKQVVDPARAAFAEIKSAITPTDERVKIEARIVELNAFLMDIEKIWLGYLSRAIYRIDEFNRGVDGSHDSLLEVDIRHRIDSVRGKKVFKFISDAFTPFRQEIAALIIEQQAIWVIKVIESYEKRYEMYKKLVEELETEGLKKLQKDIEQLESEYKSYIESAQNKYVLDALKDKINTKLAYHNLKRKKCKTIAREQQNSLLKSLSETPEKSSSLLQAAAVRAVELDKVVTVEVKRTLEGQASLPFKMRHIKGPIEELKRDIQGIKPYTKPEYSCCWALFWAIILPCFGYCLYQWWYNRQCRFAEERYIEELAKISLKEGASNPESAVTSAELTARELSPEMAPQSPITAGRSFMSYRETILTSSAVMTQAMQQARPVRKRRRGRPVVPVSTDHLSSEMTGRVLGVSEEDARLDPIEQNRLTTSRSEALSMSHARTQGFLVQLAATSAFALTVPQGVRPSSGAGAARRVTGRAH